MSKQVTRRRSSSTVEGSERKADRIAPARTARSRTMANAADMPAGWATEDRFSELKERAWLIMAIMGVALSDHPLIRQDRVSRQLVDRAKKALFDLHARIEAYCGKFHP
jgi:hypothetical protein